MHPVINGNNLSEYDWQHEISEFLYQIDRDKDILQHCVNIGNRLLSHPTGPTLSALHQTNSFWIKLLQLAVIYQNVQLLFILCNLEWVIEWLREIEVASDQYLNLGKKRKFLRSPHPGHFVPYLYPLSYFMQFLMVYFLTVQLQSLSHFITWPNYVKV